MGDIQDGQRVFDEQGHVCTVVKAHDILLDRRCYRVVFSDGSSVVADSEHLWMTDTKSSRKSAGRAVNPTIFPEARTTLQILETLICSGERNHSIRTTKPLALPEAELPIDPYVLGAWLGDGDSAGASITIGDDDATDMRANLALSGCESKSQKYRYGIGGAAYKRNTVTGRMCSNGSLHSLLRESGLIGNKHIPIQYLRASEEQRRDLLAGLMDTDGHISKRSGYVEFCSMRISLADGVYELAISLGYKPRTYTGDATLNGRIIGTKYRVCWQPQENVFRLSRKNARTKVCAKQNLRAKRRYIVGVEPVESVPVKCITVDSQSRLYLCGKAMVPTHNTRCGAEWIRSQVETGKSKRIALVGRTAADVRDVIVGGESGILAISPPWFKPEYVPSKRRLLWPNGAIATTYTADEPDQLRGPQHDAAWCFIAGTMVLTPDGERPIESIQEGDLVVTRFGARKVIAASVRESSVGKVTFSSGSALIGTPDHPICAILGWTRLDELQVGDQVCAIDALNGAANAGTGTEKVVALITSEPTNPCCLSGRYDFIERFGRRLTELFRLVLKFITETKTNSITLSKISSAWKRDAIRLSTESSILSRVKIGQPTLLNRFPVSAATLNFCESESLTDRVVQSASHEWLRTGEKKQGAAHAAVPSFEAGSETTVVNVASTWQPMGVSVVHCLKVEGQPEYVANGIVVHNCDELAAWRYPEAWDQLMFGLRLGKDPRAVVTTTPRPTPIIRDLISQKDTHLTTGSTYENQANLAKRFIDKIISKFEGTRLGRQELYAEMLDDAPGALWKREQIEALRFLSTHEKPRKLPDMKRIIVAVDPSVSADADNAATGIVVIGLGADMHGYCLEDASLVQPTPNEWAIEVDRVYRKHNADLVVGEVNQGGDLIEANVRTVNPNINYKSVRAMRGKYIRAEPIAGLTEQGKIHHVGHFAELEDELCQWEPDQGMKSPNRLDAYVWGFTEVMDEMVAPSSGYRPGVHSGGTFESAGIGMG